MFELNKTAYDVENVVVEARLVAVVEKSMDAFKKSKKAENMPFNKGWEGYLLTFEDMEPVSIRLRRLANVEKPSEGYDLDFTSRTLRPLAVQFGITVPCKDLTKALESKIGEELKFVAERKYTTNIISEEKEYDQYANIIFDVSKYLTKK